METSGGIQAIDKSSVHRICSGQVVLTLATAVKELVENAVDAGADTIEVRLKEYGSESVEVSDNGSGVEENNFAGLTLKHHTSKLRDFSDLTSVETFGFRGEALSSLCALSKMSVVTCHRSTNVATKLDFDHNGRITNQEACARQTGTTVVLENLFQTLPVRHKEFLRNLKKEFGKMVQVLSAYCIISTGVRIQCTNQIGKGKKTPVVSTNGNDSIRENISNVFGAKQMQNLIEFEQCLPSEETCTELSIRRPTEDNAIFKVSGFVSSVEHGKGRGSSDRQFYFINQRPCDFQKVSRMVNEVYHQYNKHQYPFVCLDISLDKESVDVNVTPDKRQIFVTEEKLLLAIIKTSLIQMFEPISCTYQMNQATPGSLSAAGSLSVMFGRQAVTPTVNVCNNSPLKKTSSCPPNVLRHKQSAGSTLANLKRSFSSAFAKETDSGSAVVDKQKKVDNFVLVESESPGKLQSKHHDKDSALPKQADSKKELKKADSTDSGFGSQEQSCDDARKEQDSAAKNSLEVPDFTIVKEISVEADPKARDNTGFDHMAPTLGPEGDRAAEQVRKDLQSPFPHVRDDGSDQVICDVPPNVGPTGDNIPEHKTHPQAKDSATVRPTTDSVTGNDWKKDTFSLSDASPKNHDEVMVTEYDTAHREKKRKCVQMHFSLTEIKRRVHQKSKCTGADNFTRTNLFHAKISPTDNQAAENELRKEMKKESFSQMEILGQFNKGFIITRLGDDLFIIDQHATDEKYNFEELQKNTVIQSQKMIHPQNLELTAVNENVLIENLEIFRKNGFDFEIDENADPTRRVRLTTLPVSKTWVFGKDDIEELIFMLSDQPGVLCRPSRVRMMFASRACRKSIMIGTALSAQQMRTVVSHMSELEQPWNCPHGRPTMRHLVNLQALPDT